MSFITFRVQKPKVNFPRALPLVAEFDPPIETVWVSANVVRETRLLRGQPLRQFVADPETPFQVVLRIEHVQIQIAPAHKFIIVAAADERARVSRQQLWQTALADKLIRL